VKISKIGAIRNLVEAVPDLASNPKALLLTYWKVIEKIPIPADIMRAIIERGSDPDSITRLLRFVKEDL
jgi:hypothetical protein